MTVQPPRQRTVLHIDDDRLILRLVSDLLGKWGYEVESTLCPFEGITHAASGNFPVVLIDGEMPQLDGLMTLRQIKARNPHCVAVMVTGNNTEKFIIKATDLGAADFLFKPIRDYTQLKRKVGSAFQLAEAFVIETIE